MGWRMNGWGLQTVNRFARSTPWLHGVIYDYATYGIVLFAGLILAGWWIARRHADTPMLAAVISTGVATLVAVAVNQPIVAAVHEARPYTTHPTMLVLADRSTDFSFPSDHATMAGAVAVGLLIASRRLGLLAVAAAVIMAFSRVYIGAHYPQDVLAGLALGAIAAVCVYWLTRSILMRVVRAVGNTRLRPLIAVGHPVVKAPTRPHTDYQLRYEVASNQAKANMDQLPGSPTLSTANNHDFASPQSDGIAQ